MKFKKSIALIISAIMIFASLTSLVTAATVSDISGHWSQEYVQSLVDKDIIKGYEDGTFKPDNSITRGEFCTIITKALDKAEVIDGIVEPEGKFTDVAKDSWYAEFIETAAKYEFVSGVGNNMFDPEANITRQEMAKIVSLVYCKINNEEFDVLKADSKASNLSDYSKADSWAKEYIDAAFNAGLMKGNDDGTFNPLGQVTRAETATVTYRLLDKPVPTGTEGIAPTTSSTPVPVTDPPATPGPIRAHGEKYQIQSASLANHPDYTQPPENGPPEISILWDGIANDTNSCFTCNRNVPEFVFDLGSPKDIESFAIKGYSTGYQGVYFKLFISEDNDSWYELGNDIPMSIAQPIIDDKSIYVASNFDTADGHMLDGTAPTKFDVTTTDPLFTFGNYTTRTLLDPITGLERDADVDCFASPILDQKNTNLQLDQYGFVNSNCDYLFHYFMDETHKAQYLKLVGYGNTMTQWYMFSSFQEFQVFGPGESFDKPAE